MHRRNLLKLVVFFFLTLLTIGCAPKVFSPIDFTPDGPAKARVLVAFEPTKFKTKLAHGTAKMLKAQGVFVEIDDLRNLENHPPENFDLVVMIGSVKGWRANSETMTYLENHKPVCGKALVVSTSGMGNMSGLERIKDFAPPDAITAASDTDRLHLTSDEVARTVLNKLDAE